LAWGVYTGFDWLRTGTGGGCCECGDEPSGSCGMELVRCIDFCPLDNGLIRLKHVGVMINF
jgi:hypothetical protein